MLDAPGDLLLFERRHDDESLLCIFNLGHEALEWSAPAGWRVIEAVNGDTGPLAPLSGRVLAPVSGATA